MRASPRSSSASPVSASSTLYEEVADRIASLIERGALRPGERIPSVRALRDQQGVSVSTVLHAYVLLENRGLIETRPQSGHYVRAPARPILEEPRAPRAIASAPSRVTISELVQRVYGTARDRTIVPLGAACPADALLPTEALNRALVAVARRAGPAAAAYDMPPGNDALRTQIAKRSLGWGCALSPDEIITTSGAMEALNLCLRAVARAGDAIAVESPAYYGLLQMIEGLGMRAVEIPAHPRTGVDVDALAQTLRRVRIKACMLVPSFQNPLGSCMPDERREELVRLLDRHDVPLIEDDIYGDLHFGPQRPRACKRWDRRGSVLLCGSFSKTLAPGYRVGFVAPGRYFEKVELLKFTHTVATASLPQMAIAAYLQDGGYDRHLRALRRTLATQVERVAEAIATAFPEGTRVTRPQGGLVLWVELPRGVAALELHRRALRAKIGITPGPLFSAKGQRFQTFIRVQCGNPWSERIARSIATLGRIARDMAAGSSAA